ncbi:MAG: ABC transporter substrate-binding protein [Chromatiaceae bacterium]|nr:ABC transporter substrate-binding protein [Gammaproteobacteria bacterium]MCP5313341.1 ABC transporter substrate-binding protein [Chromatiaceae bacterium]
MPSWIRIRRLLCLAILVSGCYTQPVGSSTQPIKILTLDWTSQVVASHIVGLLLQRLGYPVSYLAEDADSQWFLLSSGQADLQVEVWEGSMASKMNELTRRGLVVDAGTHTALTREEWWYPKYAKAACPGLPDWTALKACAAQFSDGSNELGVYYTGPWEKPDRARIRALGLPFRVVELADAAALRGVLEDAARHTRPVVLFNWTPNWVESVYPGEFVEFPAYAEACETDPEWGINRRLAWDCGNPKDGWLKKAVSRTFPETWPCGFALVRAIDFSNADIATAAALVEVQGYSAPEAAAHWLDAHQPKSSAWIEQAGCTAAGAR